MTEDRKKKAGGNVTKQLADASARLEPFFNQINGLTRLQRFLVVAVTMVVLCGGFFYLLYLPKMQALAQIREDTRLVEDRIVRARANLRQLKPLQEERAEKEMAFKEAMRALPERREIPMFLSSISASGRDAGLDFLLFKPESEVLREFYAEIPVSVEMVGGFHETVTFLDHLARMPRVVNVRGVEMQSQADREKGQTIRTRCQIVTYRFVEVASASGESAQRGHAQ
ncbi:type 4a pilus biogenesis protein PilO [Desulfobotulus sp. H1]|uniref:Type 4a pilus biogenesis protein PilO n=1 Tax=Desulfobotulus pelophilus TaxID=2823377 RepID=A0ABT3NB99_9BACT|nr:type 4a pilus biogenesis protein PilO [Desulfobotulus pelophilus]MCW7754745.1 type 4a pilus biogenesis protein PilO [Desulfobotulus pelophilus]